MKANTDTTYCVNKECDKKCSRHESHYEFEEKEYYSFQAYCMEWLERKQSEEQSSTV